MASAWKPGAQRELTEGLRSHRWCICSEHELPSLVGVEGVVAALRERRGEAPPADSPLSSVHCWRYLDLA